MKALVIAASGLHLGYLGCYGNEWIATPALDRLAATGVVCDQHYSERPDAFGARQAWLTGCCPIPLVETGAALPAAGQANLIRLLRGHGVSAMLVAQAGEQTGEAFLRDWEHVLRVAPGAKAGAAFETTWRVVQKALDQLGSWDHGLLWVEMPTLLPPWAVAGQFLATYFDEIDEEEPKEEEEMQELTHTPLLNPAPGILKPDDEGIFLRLQRTLAAAVAAFDADVQRLLEELQERGLYDELLLMVTTDRGQALGEHGLVGDYRPWLHDELVHLPLLLRLPDTTAAGLRLGALTQPVDLMPTLLEFFGAPCPAVQGQSLLPLVRGGGQMIRSCACSGLEIGEALEWALRTLEWAFILPVRNAPGDLPRPMQLYVKPDDRWERNNVLQHHPELAEHLEQTLRGFIRASNKKGSDPLNSGGQTPFC